MLTAHPSDTDDETTYSEMKRQIKMLKEADIIGQQIRSIWFRKGTQGEKGWLDSFECWIDLQNDLVIQVPGSGGAADWKSVELPKKAKRMEPEPKFLAAGLLRSVFKVNGRKKIINEDQPLVGTKIVAIYSRLFENEIDTSLSSVVELSDGRALSETSIAPHGTRGASLFIHSKQELFELKKNGMVSFFPMKKN